MQANSRLGPYEILGPLGAGGMGEVYRAHDSRLARDVAIKALPTSFSQDPDRLARFEREAKLLASLSHPNIAGIHGLEESPSGRYLILELVEGETLADRLARGALPIDEAIAVGMQMAAALEAAHEAGVIHRDLKPGNVMLKPDGTVKVLDFGLARGASGASDASLSNSPTLAQSPTLAGVILGTAAYMSPEQARGKPVDRRTDIWSFGCVLYECLTARQAFAGETVSDIIARVLQSEPDWSALPKQTPLRLRELLVRCLTRDAKERLRDLGDARLELSALREGAYGDVGAAPSARSSGWRYAAAFAAGVALMALTGMLLWQRPATQSPSIARFRLGDIDMSADPFQSLALSPDGLRMAYSGRTGIRLRAFDALAPIQITESEAGWLPFFAPDGQRLGFYGRGGLRTAPVTGGASQLLVQLAGGGFSGATWASDDWIYFASFSQRIGRVHPAAGKVEYLDLRGLKPDEFVVSLASLPEPEALLCGMRSGSRFEIAVLDLQTLERTVIAENGFTPAYVQTGHVLYQQDQNGSLMALPFDAKRRTPVGAAFPVVSDIGTRLSFQVKMFDVAPNGTLAYVPRRQQNDRGALLQVDRKGAPTQLFEFDRIFDLPRLSPDGRRLAFRAPAPNCDIWMRDLERGVNTRLTYEGDNHGIAWFPDGSRLAFARGGEDGLWEVMAASVDGTGSVEVLSDTSIPRASVTSMSPDSKFLLVGSNGDTAVDVYLVDIAARSARPLLNSRFEEAAAVFSPDGRYIAYVSNDSGRDEVYLQSFPALDRREQISTDGGRSPLWSRDGRELFYRQDRQLLSVEVSTQPALRIGRPELLFDSELSTAGLPIWANYELSADGQSFLMLRDQGGAGGAEVHIVLNWLSELESFASKQTAH